MPKKTNIGTKGCERGDGRISVWHDQKDEHDKRDQMSAIRRSLRKKTSKVVIDQSDSNTESDTCNNFATPPATPARQPDIRSALSLSKPKLKMNESVSKPNTETENMEVSQTSTAKTNSGNIAENGAANFELQAIHTMFKSLESKVEEAVKKIEAKVDDKILKIDTTEVSSLKKEVQYQKFKTETVVGTMQHMHQVIEDLTKRVESLEVANTRNAIIISGLGLEGKKVDLAKEFECFAELQLGVRITVEEAYNIGAPPFASTVVFLQSAAEKREIIAAKSQLKNVKIDGNMIYINSYHPASVNERIRRERDIKWANSQQDENLQSEIKKVKGKLVIGGSVYQKIIREPSPEDLLDISIADLVKIMELPISKGEWIYQGDSSFLAYVAAVENYKQIQKLYTKVRIIHAKERHVVCAYYLPGPDIHINRDGCDDQELGASRSLIRLLVEGEMENRVVFVVRKCGKDKLGNDRFLRYVEAATKVLQDNPWNDVLRKNQIFPEEEACKRVSKTANEEHTGQANIRPGAYQERGRRAYGRGIRKEQDRSSLRGSYGKRRNTRNQYYNYGYRKTSTYSFNRGSQRSYRPHNKPNTDRKRRLSSEGDVEGGQSSEPPSSRRNSKDWDQQSYQSWSTNDDQSARMSQTEEKQVD